MRANKAVFSVFNDEQITDAIDYETARSIADDDPESFKVRRAKVKTVSRHEQENQTA